MWGGQQKVLAIVMGPGMEWMLNTTFGNAVELIISIFSVESWFNRVVTPFLNGFDLGNFPLLLVGGFAVLFVGGTQI